MLSHLNPYSPKRITFNSEVTAESTNNILQLIMAGREEYTGKRAMNDRISLLKASAYLNNRDEVRLEDVWLVESMLQMCRKITLSSSEEVEYYYGDRLHFQIRLRQLLGYSNEEIKKQLDRTFTWWDDAKPLYTEDLLKTAFSSLEAPIWQKQGIQNKFVQMI